MVFRAQDFMDGAGQGASPQAAAEIANRRIAKLISAYNDETSGTVEKFERVEEALCELVKGDIFPGTFHFEHLGRLKVPVTFSVQNEPEFFAELQKHLLSTELEYEFHPEINKGEVFVGGFRSVGVFTRSDFNGQAD